MVNGNYVLYGDRPSSESEIVDDHVHSRSHDRKNKRKANRTANELQHSLNLAQLDNETDSVKYEKKINEPRLLRYVPTSEVKENFVTEKFETYDLKPTEERPRRYAFTKKPKNPADGSVNYAYSRSSSSCSSPNGNLPTISEHGEQYGTYRVRAHMPNLTSMPNPTVNDLIPGYDTKLDKYFSKPRDVKPFSAKGSHPDSLYRVSADSGTGAGKVTRMLRVIRWPVALILVCVALAVFVYFLMPDNLETRAGENGTYWEPVVAGQGPQPDRTRPQNDKKPDKNAQGTKTSEIDFYDADIDKNTADTIPKRKLPIPPVFPTHLTPEVQYGNEKADTDNLRTAKVLDNVDTDDSTLKPHITQKPEKPLAIYFKNFSAATTEVITRAETINDFINYDHKQLTNKNVQYAQKDKSQIHTGRVEQHDHHNHEADRNVPIDVQEFYVRRPSEDLSFTSGHSKLFGISIEDAEKMKSTTQSSLYNTRVSPTLPTWRDEDDSTTKKYPSNIYSEVQCRSTRMSLCRGILPYDLAGAPAKIGNVEATSLLSQIDYLVSTNCSDRVKHFLCALLEPECSPPPYPTKMPCYSLCKAIFDSCDGQIPTELIPAFNCKRYSRANCVGAKTPCYQREFSCADGTCVPRDWLCDGTKDCPAGEDEGAACIKCDESEYRCSSGGCILKRWLCDGYSDCPNGEDEHVEMCGARAQHVAVADAHDAAAQAAADTHEPGEESAGSAPAPAIRRPNRVPIGQKVTHHRAGENESSKELLVTSDSNNSLKRNFTRRPLPPRLSHYYHTQPTRPTKDLIKPLTTEAPVVKPNPKTPEVETELPQKELPQKELPQKELTLKESAKTVPEKESVEDINMGDLGFFDEFDKEPPPAPRAQKLGQPTNVVRFGVPEPKQQPIRPAEPASTATQATHLDKTGSKLDRVIDGAALMRKAVAQNAADMAEDPAANDTFTYADDTPDLPAVPESTHQVNRPVVTISKSPSVSLLAPAAQYGSPMSNAEGRGWSSAHASPCPSGELRCVDGRCITLAQLCDGTIDCSDHADEDNCYT
ncbi:hypothetical protein PYW08_006832 [Mythimna loreyi]|uniref:Uncharacterized protein n=1 Tax=Mythimna loreyi TaxID=667449 RepID=A0ACC2RA88_9NEOP|nr:hypothetical protein PYW08_006832 [Mythimna loreyi]